MARPYNYAPDSSRSPLDQRSASPFAAGQAPSLKTNVNRAKTKRWVEAKSYTYDGDDWGDYDDDDQYGVEENQSLAPPKPVGLRQKGQTLGSSPASSSLSSDQAGLNRSNSYEHGDEQRAFLSGSQGSRALAGASKGDEGEHSIRSDASQSSLGYQKHRNFSPSVVPQPLYAKTTPSPSNEEVGKRYPARKSSLKADEIPIEQVSRSGQKSETSNLAEHDQPSIAGGAPFIRPADIYKRMEAEREKERLSLDSQRSGSDRSPHSAIGRHGSPGQTLRSRSGSPGQARDPIVTVGGDEPESKATLSPVLETDRGSGPTSTPAIGLIPSGNDSGLTTTGLNYGKTASNTSQPLNRSSFLPQVHRISGFGDDLWSSANNDTQSNDPKADLNSTEVHAPESKDFAAGEKSSLPESKSSVGYKAIVQQAFDRPDRSAMRTPLSAQESLDSYSVSRSNTDSTAGISPILSRMPSGAAVAKTRAKEAEMRAIVTPSINEESPQAQSSNYLTSLTSGQRIPRKPASRSTSGEYDTRQVIDNRSSELNSQSSHRVIANLPTVEQSYDSQHSAEADFEKATMGPNSPIYKDDGTFKQAMPSSKAPLTVDTEQNNRNSRIAARISDLSANSSKSPEATVLRAESPTKGRVRDLAGRFNDGSSKRDSSPSPSRSSMISLGKTKSDFSVLPAGQRNSIISDVSGRQPDSDRPTAQREASFRPYIPGRWESYNTTAGTPMPYDNEENKATSSDVDPVRSRRAADPSPLTQTEEEQHDSDSVDLTPKKTDGGSADDTDLSPDPLHMASLSQAGKAVGEALRASIGLERDDKKDRAGDDKERAVESTSTQIEAPIDEASQYVERKQSHSSASSSSAPSPPVKDRPAADRGNSDYFRAPEPLSVAGAGRSKQTQSRILRRTEESSLSDQDSDRLREEIEQTLSPAKSSEDMVEDKSRSQQMSSQTSPITSVVNRESSVFPSEYDSYWASTDAHATGRQSLASPLGTATESAPNKTEKDKVLVAPVSPAVHELPSYTPSDSKPKLSTRFSWETDISTPAKAGAANDKSEIESSTSPLIIGSQSSSQAQVAEPSPQPSAKDNFEEINLERRDSTGGELQPQMAAFGESSDPQIQTLSSSLGKEVTPEVPPKASSTTKPTPELPSTLDGKGDVSESALSYNEAFNASNSAVQQPSSRMRSESLPSNQPAIRQSTAWRPPPFREILAIKSPNERIETYDRYRAQLISTDSGLSQWIKSTIANQPEHSKMVNNPYGQPLSVSTSFPASLRQRGDSTSRLQSAAVAGTASAHPTMHHQASPQSSGGVAGSGARLSSQQVQAKGKDLLHSAGVIGGKASTISKGLFAKGRSRFKGGGSEKARSPSTERTRERTHSISFTSHRRSSRTSSLFAAGTDNNPDEKGNFPALTRTATPPPHLRPSSGAATAAISPSTLADSAIPTENEPRGLSNTNTNNNTSPATSPLTETQTGVGAAPIPTTPTVSKTTATTATTATTPAEEITPTRPSPSQRMRNFSPFRRRSSNNRRQSRPSTIVVAGDAEYNSNKKSDDTVDQSTRPVSRSRARSLSGNLLLLGRQLRAGGQIQARQQDPKGGDINPQQEFSGQMQGLEKQQQQQQQQNQDLKQKQEWEVKVGEEEQAKLLKERRRRSLFALPFSVSLPASMSRSLSYGDDSKQKRSQAATALGTQSQSQSQGQTQTMVQSPMQASGLSDPWGWGEPPTGGSAGMRLPSGRGRVMSEGLIGRVGGTGIGAGGGRLLSEGSVVTVPARLGILPSPPEATFPAGVKERMVSSEMREKHEKEDWKKERIEEGIEGELKGKKEEGGDDNANKASGRVDNDKKKVANGTVNKMGDDSDDNIAMSGIWVKGQSVASPIEENKRIGDGKVHRSAGEGGDGQGQVQEQDQNQDQDQDQIFAGDLEGSKSRYDRIYDTESEPGEKNQASGIMVGKQVINGDVEHNTLDTKTYNSFDKDLVGRDEQLVGEGSYVGSTSPGVASNGLSSDKRAYYDTTPTQTQYLIAKPEVLQTEVVRSPNLSLPLTGSGRTSLALSFHTATDGSISQQDQDLYGWEKAARDRGLQDKEESLRLAPLMNNSVPRSRYNDRSFSPRREGLRAEQDISKPATLSTENGANGHNASVTSPTPQPVYFKTNSTYYNPVGAPVPSPQVQPSRPSVSSERSAERSYPITSTESDLTKLKPKKTPSDIMKALKNASRGANGGVVAGENNRRASTGGSVPTDPRRSPDAPPVPPINPAFLKVQHGSVGQTGPRRAVTDSVALARNQDKSSKRKSLMRIGNLFRRLSSKGSESSNVKPDSTSEQLPTTPTKREKRRSLAFMSRQSYHAGSPKEKDQSSPVPTGFKLNQRMGGDKRRASMPASVPSQSSWQSDLTTLPPEAGRYGSSQYWENMYRTSGLALGPPSPLPTDDTSPYKQQLLPPTPSHQNRRKMLLQQQRQNSERQVQLNSYFRRPTSTIEQPGQNSDSFRVLPNNPRRASAGSHSATSAAAAAAAAAAIATTAKMPYSSNVAVRGRVVSPSLRSSATMPADKSLREMTPPLPPLPPLSLAPSPAPAPVPAPPPILRSASTMPLSETPLPHEWTSHEAQQQQRQPQQQQDYFTNPFQEERPIPELDASGNNNSRHARGLSQDEQAPIMHAASYPGMEWVPEFYDES